MRSLWSVQYRLNDCPQTNVVLVAVLYQVAIDGNRDGDIVYMATMGVVCAVMDLCQAVQTGTTPNQYPRLVKVRSIHIYHMNTHD